MNSKTWVFSSYDQQFPLIAMEPLSRMSRTWSVKGWIRHVAWMPSKERSKEEVRWEETSRGIVYSEQTRLRRGEITGCGQREVRGTGRNHEVSVLKSGRGRS